MIVAVFLCLCLSQPDHSHSHFTRWPCSLLTSNISVSTPRPAFSALATEPHRTAPLPLLQPNIDTASPPAPPATNKQKKYALKENWFSWCERFYLEAVLGSKVKESTAKDS